MIHEDLNFGRRSQRFSHSKSGMNAWEGHKRANTSIIVDLLHGMTRSTLQCPDCRYISVTYEPFTTLTLPIVETNAVQREMFVVNEDGSLEKRQFKISETSSIKEIRMIIAEKMSIKLRQVAVFSYSRDRK